MKYCIANWKMNMTHGECRNYFHNLAAFTSDIRENLNDISMIICPPYTLLDLIWHDENFITLTNGCDSILGVQNFYPQKKGAYTGEISLNMIAEVKWAIIGHSERRSLFNESNEFINLKVKTALDNNIRPILCVGETLEERESGKTEDILFNQLKDCLKDVSYDEDFLIAYEPVWAIGTGKNAENDTIESANKMILSIIKELKYDIQEPKILYGGSVNNNNAENLSKICNLDGFLIGGASLDAEQFYSIYNALKGE